MSEIGQLVGGVWLPATETHLSDWMLNSKRRQEVNGRLTYQYHKLSDAVKRCKKHEVAIDIGAHCGLWSMHLVDMFKTVECFEPIPLHRELFLRNVGGNFTLHECALGEKEDVVSIEVPDQTTGNAHIAIGKRHPGTRHVENPDKQKVYGDIQVKTLDSFCLEPDFIKIDVEGFERAVIQGGEQTIRTHKPIMVVEQKGNDSAYGDVANAAVMLLRSWGAKELACMSGDYIMGW